jgi:hypothetical protein
MKSYFIAGYSKFVTGEKWSFCRVWETDDDIHPSAVFLEKATELETSLDNFRDGRWGELVITTFNQV